MIKLMQFYTPLFASFQVLTRSKELSLPRYVILWQLVTRVILLLTLTVASCLIYLNIALDENEKLCLLSRKAINTAFTCLNESTIEKESVVEEHRVSIYTVGATCALFSAIIMLKVSQSIFTSFRCYINKLIPVSKAEILAE